jgi:hypothetical protein
MGTQSVHVYIDIASVRRTMERCEMNFQTCQNPLTIGYNRSAAIAFGFSLFHKLPLIFLFTLQHLLFYRAFLQKYLVGHLVAEEILGHQITDRQSIWYNIPQAVVYSLMLLRMGRIVARNMSS